MTVHAEIIRLSSAISMALDSIAVGDSRKAVALLYDVLEVFDDSSLSRSQEIWQLFDAYLAVVTVCAAKASPDESAAAQLFVETVRLKLNRVRP